MGGERVRERVRGGERGFEQPNGNLKCHSDLFYLAFPCLLVV